MKLPIRKYWLIAFVTCTGSVLYYLNTRIDDDLHNSTGSANDSVLSSPASRQFTKKAVLENDSSTFEPVSFDRYRPQ